MQFQLRRKDCHANGIVFNAIRFRIPNKLHSLLWLLVLLKVETQCNLLHSLTTRYRCSEIAYPMRRVTICKIYVLVI